VGIGLGVAAWSDSGRCGDRPGRGVAASESRRWWRVPGWAMKLISGGDSFPEAA
jgi:hypothetical protein